MRAGQTAEKDLIWMENKNALINTHQSMLPAKKPLGIHGYARLHLPKGTSSRCRIFFHKNFSQTCERACECQDDEVFLHGFLPQEGPI